MNTYSVVPEKGTTMKVVGKELLDAATYVVLAEFIDWHCRRSYTRKQTKATRINSLG